MSLLRLPNELLFIIAERLQPTEILTLVQTCHQFACLFIRKLDLDCSVAAMFWAAAIKNEALVRLLLAEMPFWIRILDRDNHGYFTERVHETPAPPSDSVVKFVLDQGANLVLGDLDVGDFVHDIPTTGLYWSIYNGEKTLMKLLLEHGADTERRPSPNRGQTAIHRAMWCEDNIDLIKLLLDYGADINTKDQQEQTPLHIAVQCYEVESTMVLLANGADVNARDYKGMTALHLTVLEAKDFPTESYIIVKSLLENGADINAQDHKKKTAIHLAMLQKRRRWPHKIIDLLLSKGPDLTIQDDRGETVLHKASRKGKLALVKSVLGQPCVNTSIQNWSNGLTALHLAAAKNRIEVMKLLLNNGADMTIQNFEGKTPRDLICNKNLEDLVEMFQLSSMSPRNI